ncbi:ImmA/IrrE family metallo-endopeptidase [Alkalicoccobacillus plakortidis]|uniref:ImmA/IrrE family metallo-endopeptidase n=1 Tax=Alkalicoccobacillus plakortidis TaxID=444060 RepID=A0ABT0XHY1_9BACI|nr:ImmA/IrrE family metallo-endopeptidase [Alkalicoccobacillus plakortidis]MCM2675513.1 ImmA/IrrE family metallo-endopeptidase [Alkalicoccobacillus plakortidis]
MYEKLLRETEHHEIDTYEKPMSEKIKGLYSDKVVLINQNIDSNVEKTCILAEELGHYHTSSGNILDQKKLINRKQEKKARNWAYKRLVPISKIIKAYNSGIKNNYELASFLGVTEEFLVEALIRYKEKYGLTYETEQFIISFEPLIIKQK